MSERLAAVSFVVFVLFALSQPALAAPPIFVGNGTAASCTETALGDALVIAATVGGGAIRFKCGREPITIELTATLIPPDDTMINGNGLITLTSIDVLPLVFVSSDTTVVLNDLSLVVPELPSSDPAVYGVLNQGTLTVKKSTFRNLTGVGSFVFCCPGIRNQGTLTIDDSTFSGNGTFDKGAAILNEGTLTVKNSEFLGNQAGLSGGAIYNVGTLTVRNSTFSGNAALFEFGGGIYNIGGSATVAHSTFFGGFAGIGGGAIWGGLVSVHNSEFSSNLASFFGGAVGGASLTVKNSTFSNNHVCCSFGDGGAIYGGGTIQNSTFSDNFAYHDGGAIWGGGTIQNSTFSGNVADHFGGAIFDFGSSIENSTITQNTAGVAGGGIYNAGTLSLTRTSVTGNTPDDIFP